MFTVDFSGVADIARVAHETNRAYCRTLGDHSQLPWDESPVWQQDSAIEGVTGIMEGDVTEPSQSHENWMNHKIADGWVYGAQKNPEIKTHPCLVPYSELPADQRRKDALFFTIVKCMLEGL